MIGGAILILPGLQSLNMKFQILKFNQVKEGGGAGLSRVPPTPFHLFKFLQTLVKWCLSSLPRGVLSQRLGVVGRMGVSLHLPELSSNFTWVLSTTTFPSLMFIHSSDLPKVSCLASDKSGALKV